MKQNNGPSLFQFTNDYGCNVTIDLEQLTHINVTDRWIGMGELAWRAPKEEVERVHTAWVAFKGKFDPSKER